MSKSITGCYQLFRKKMESNYFFVIGHVTEAKQLAELKMVQTDEETGPMSQSELQLHFIIKPPCDKFFSGNHRAI